MSAKKGFHQDEDEDLKSFAEGKDLTFQQRKGKPWIPSGICFVILRQNFVLPQDEFRHMMLPILPLWMVQGHQYCSYSGSRSSHCCWLDGMPATNISIVQAEP